MQHADALPLLGLGMRWGWQRVWFTAQEAAVGVRMRSAGLDRPGECCTLQPCSAAVIQWGRPGPRGGVWGTAGLPMPPQGKWKRVAPQIPLRTECLARRGWVVPCGVEHLRSLEVGDSG